MQLDCAECRDDMAFQVALVAEPGVMADSWYVGNAAADGKENRGWLLGHFLEGSNGVRASDAVEVKWGIHPAGDWPR